MNSIIQKLKTGHELKPMDSAGSFFEDGFFLSYSKNGLTGNTEVLTSTVLDLEKRGLIFFNHKLWRYILTKKGQDI